MELFNFALRHEGFLFLGSSESAENAPRLFAVIDKKDRIYKSVGATSKPPLPLTHGKWEVHIADEKVSGDQSPISFGAIHHKIVEEYAPPSVLINEEYDIVHSSENAGRFLHFAAGEPSRNLLNVVHPALRLDLRAALAMAKQETREAEVRHVPLKLEKEDRMVDLIVRCKRIPELARTFFLIIFDEGGSSVGDQTGRSLTELIADDEAVKMVVARLEDELQETRNRLRASVEQSETSTEELKASNEELQAINEELHSASEELETSKEELQSLNEELTTVNQELKEKVDEVSRVNSDLQNLMHSTDIGTIFLDRDLQIKRYTPRVEELFNIISSDIGRPLEHVTHKLDYDNLSKDASEVLQMSRPLDRQVSGGSNHGHYLARISPYRTSENRIDGVVISFVEITELKHATDALRDRELMLRMAQDAAKCGVWTLFLKDGRAWWSDECYQVRGVAPGSVEMTMHNWIYGFHSEEGKQVENAIRHAVENHTEYNFESKIVLPSGRPRWLMEVGRGVYDEQNEPIQISGITLDITERIEGREAQAQHLADRARDAEALKEADRRKNEFLATLSHELRNPLEAIRMSLPLLESKDDRVYAESVISRQVNQIINLVDDLLDISRIAQGKITLRKTRFELAEAVQFAIDTNRCLTEERKHRLIVSLPKQTVYVNGDFTRISQIFLNLLNNAVKYTEPGGTIWLTARHENGQLTVSIKDTGIGIEPQKLPHIFNSFIQIEKKSQPSGGGLGIGLGLVKKLVELHGGAITAYSEGLGKGSEFMVQLPADADQSAIVMPEVGQAPSARRAQAQRVLIVDDHVDSAETLKLLLTHSGYETFLAHDGERAIQVANEHKPEVALLDIGLPDMNGYEVARALRSILPTLRLIAISGWNREEDRKRSAEAGFDYHLVKPVDLSEVRRLLSNGR